MRNTFFIIELFVWFNISFLAVDTYYAHSANSFRLSYEWIPVYFSLLIMLCHGFILFFMKVNNEEALRKDVWGRIFGALCIVLAVMGIYFHLDSHFFTERTINNLIYSAPFIAPLAYGGLGFLYLINRIKLSDTKRIRLILLVATLGIVGNFLLSLFDHAQNGFYYATEWIPVIVSAWGVAVLLPLCFGLVNKLQIQIAYMTMLLQIAVGFLGFFYHFMANINGVSSLIENFIFGAPVFAPLLFVDLALLALIPLYHLKRDLQV